MKSKKVLIAVLAVIIPFLIILGAFRLSVFDIESESDVEGRDKIISDLVYFLRNKEAGVDYISSFRDVEQEHLLEVKGFIHVLLGLFNFALIVYIAALWLLFYADKKNFLKNLGSSFFYGGLATSGIVVLLFLAGINFDWLFFAFHNLFFQTQWQFPADHLLIRLFPQQFFFAIFKKILVISLVGGLVVGGIGYLIEKYIKVDKKK